MRLNVLLPCFCCARRTQEYKQGLLRYICIATAAAAASASQRLRVRRSPALRGPGRGAQPQPPLAAVRVLATVAPSPYRHPRRYPHRAATSSLPSRRRSRRRGMLRLSVALLCVADWPCGGCATCTIHVPHADFVRGAGTPPAARNSVSEGCSCTNACAVSRAAA